LHYKNLNQKFLQNQKILISKQKQKQKECLSKPGLNKPNWLAQNKHLINKTKQAPNQTKSNQIKQIKQTTLLQFTK
jgi:hypothetical protein